MEEHVPKNYLIIREQVDNSDHTNKLVGYNSFFLYNTDATLIKLKINQVFCLPT